MRSHNASNSIAPNATLLLVVCGISTTNSSSRCVYYFYQADETIINGSTEILSPATGVTVALLWHQPQKRRVMLADVLCFYSICCCNHVIGFGWPTLQPLAGSSSEPGAQSAHALLSIIRPACSSSMNDRVQLKCVPFSGQITPRQCNGHTALCAFCGVRAEATVCWCEVLCYPEQSLLEGNSLRDDQDIQWSSDWQQHLLPAHVCPSVLREKPGKQEQRASPLATAHRWLQGPLSGRKTRP